MNDMDQWISGVSPLIADEEWSGDETETRGAGRVLVVGEVIKDVYLKLDEQKNRFETDGKGVSWLDLVFDGGSHEFFARHAVMSGAAVSLEVLSRFGIDTKIAGVQASWLEGQLVMKDLPETYRYVLCKGEEITYFRPSEVRATGWQMPDGAVDWIYVDRSAQVSQALVEEILGYLALAEETRLAVFVSKRTDLASEHTRRLLERANLVMADVPVEMDREIVQIGDGMVEYKGQRARWDLRKKQDLLTHLTTSSIIAATVLGAELAGKSSSEALLLARANVENANLDGTTSLAKLEDIIVGEDYLLENDSKKEDKMAKARETAQKLMVAGKGILAADESGGSIAKKFASMDIEDTEENRRDYRNIFFTTPDLEKYASGVILFDETARQRADNGQDFVTFLTLRGVIPGIKVDQGLEDLPGTDEKYTKGLEGLGERLAEYYAMGLRFAKWRAAFEISDGTPSETAIVRNAEILAQYAADCQAAGIVPIVEPEVVYDGYYTVGRCAEVTGEILDRLFEKLAERRVDLGACILKVNMVLAGKRYETQSTPAEVGAKTAEVLRAHVPEGLAGVVFLSGGQGPEQATENLQAVTNNGPFAWPVSFSFARALQDPALFAWRGVNGNADRAREAFRVRLMANGEALRKK